ncbi:MAG TPA: DUF423 domain-containing protein [Verrucomicrobiae bacterium]|nr:DUF423 domain-containing protein [Verrucomicrobiae bacterium]
MNQRLATRIAAAMGFLAVALGAFGAHALKPLLTQNGMAAVWETVVFYHFIHAVMLFVLAGESRFRRFLVGVFWWALSFSPVRFTSWRR